VSFCEAGRLHCLDTKTDESPGLKEEVMSQQWKGIVPAVPSPCNENGELDLESMERLVELLLEDGADGLYICGTTGESLLLSESERKAICETTLRTTAGRCPVAVHVGSLREQETVNLARHAEEAGADAVSAIPPIHFPSTTESILDYYSRLGSVTEIPLIVYHLPALGAGLPREALGRLGEVAGVGGIKFTDGDMAVLLQIRQELGPQFVIFSGMDSAALEALQLGANAMIGTNPSYLCPVYKGMSEAIDRGDMRRAAELQEQALTVRNRIMSPAALDAAKLVLRYRGLDVGRVRNPLPRMSDAQIEDLYRWLDSFEVEKKLIAAR
jgi:N-acetylneuraminate lyase